MKKTAIASVLTSILIAPTAFAAGFDGFGVGLDMHLKSTGGDHTSTIEGSSFTDKETNSVGGEYNAAAGIDLNYGYLVTPDFLVRFGATATFGTQDVDSTNSVAVNTVVGGTEIYSSKSSVEESDHYSVYFAPGMMVTENTLVYGKLSYHRMDLSSKSSERFVDTSGVATETSLSGSKKFSGIGIGAGVETRLTDNLFLSAEVQHVRYGKETLSETVDTSFNETEKVTAEPTSNIGTIGLTYRF